VNAHSAVQAPRKLSWARRRLGFRALLVNAPPALPSLPRSPSLVTPRMLLILAWHTCCRTFLGTAASGRSHLNQDQVNAQSPVSETWHDMDHGADPLDTAWQSGPMTGARK
jgi:hypothetical protein